MRFYEYLIGPERVFQLFETGITSSTWCAYFIADAASHGART